MTGESRQDLISGRFELDRLLGSGGSASVFEARDVTGAEPERIIALKILHPHLSSSEPARAAFFAEAEAVSRVQHRNVVRVVGTGVHEGGDEKRAWIAFERVPGMTLGDLVADRGPLPPRDALAIITGVLSGLEAVHAAGLVHRDLSPTNIAAATGPGEELAPDGVRILDFGLAAAPGLRAMAADVVGASAHELGVIGSVNYLSTEHALGRPVGEAGDLYQVAGLLHLLVTGRPPFPRATAEEVMRAHAEAPPPVPSVQDSSIPRSIDRIVVRGMLKRPQARFGSAVEMRSAVIAAAAGIAGGTRQDPDRATRVFVPRAGIDMVTRFSEPRTMVLEPGSRGHGATTGDRERTPRSPEYNGMRPRAVATLIAVIAAGVATVWLVAASAAPAAPQSAPPSSSKAALPPTTAPSAPTAAAVPAVGAVQVPQVVGLGRDAAAGMIRSAGLVNGPVNSHDSGQPAGIVLEVSPAPGTPVRRGTQVSVVVASGSNVVPSVTAGGAVAAGSAITTAGFAPVERTVIDATVPDGTVIGSEPSAGTSLPLGSAVTIVTTRHPPSSATTTPTPTAPPSAAPIPSSTPRAGQP